MALVLTAALLAVGAWCWSGCGTTPSNDWINTAQSIPYTAVRLMEGDTVGVTFAGNPDLNTVQKVRRDGKITLPLIGEVEAKGKTAKELEEELAKLYKPQLQLTEITVTIESSVLQCYVTGAVLRPGKVVVDRPITALEAIMEAGGFDYSRANVKKVVVIRQRPNETQRFILNFDPVLKGQKSNPFYLRPFDIVYVPERAF